jgi:hypothetical protein
MLVLIGGIDGDKAPSQFATGAVAGMTIGLAAATYVALRSDSSSDTTARPLPTPSISPSRERILVSLGGSF